MSGQSLYSLAMREGWHIAAQIFTHRIEYGIGLLSSTVVNDPTEIPKPINTRDEGANARML